MNPFLRNAVNWAVLAVWLAFLAGGTKYPFFTPILLVCCAAAYFIVACNLLVYHDERKADA